MINIRYEDLPNLKNNRVTYSYSYMSRLSDLKENTDPYHYVTLGKNQWRLDGSYVLPDKDTRLYFWSSVASNREGVYEKVPSVTIDFSAPIDLSALTFVFDDEQYEIAVSYYLDGIPISEKTYINDSTQYILKETILGFDRIKIRFLRSIEPNRFVKIKNFALGRRVVFDNAKSVSLITEVDPIGAEMPVDELSFSVTDAGEHGFLFQDRQKMYFYHNDELIGLYYVKSAVRTSAQDYSITCTDALGLLDETVHYGGMYTDMPADELISDVAGPDLEVDCSRVEGMTVTGYLPVAARRRQLMQICFALGVTATTFKRDHIVIVRPARVTTASVLTDRIFYGGSAKTAQRKSAVRITSHSWALSADRQQLYKGKVTGETTITTGTPAADYAITGGEIIRSDVNYVVVIPNSPGADVEITGRPYEDNIVTHIKKNATATIDTVDNVVQVTDATLINSENAEELLKSLYEYYLLLDTIQQKIVVYNERPGQQVISKNPFGLAVEGYITKMEMNFTQNAYATVTIVGREVPLRPAPVYAGEIFARETVWIA